uniref:Uncharacterized protein n=1 Tax=Steinernema glaseri TaxID=37863 RepID=A0A1I7YYA9_9BILA
MPWEAYQPADYDILRERKYQSRKMLKRCKRVAYVFNDFIAPHNFITSLAHLRYSLAARFLVVVAATMPLTIVSPRAYGKQHPVVDSGPGICVHNSKTNIVFSRSWYLSSSVSHVGQKHTEIW